MSKLQSLSPRNVLKGLAASRFLLGARIAAWSPIGQPGAEQPTFAPNLFVAIMPGGDVTIVV